jgi:hypothetical protein
MLQGYARTGGFVPITGVAPLQNARHERFALARSQGNTLWDSYKLAGYTGDPKNGGYQVSKRKGVKERIKYLSDKVAELTVSAAAVTRHEITEGVRDTIRLAKEGTPVLAKNGEVTDVKKLDLASANRGYEILAKMNGLMVDVTRDDNLDTELEGKSPEELKHFVLSLLEQLDPNLRKKVESQMDIEAAEECGESTDSTERSPTLQ